MHFRAFRNLCFFYALWLGGAFAIPIALLCMVFNVYLPIIALVIYYSIRSIFPASKWEWMRQVLMTDDTPYCNSARIIFDNNSKAPKPYSKTLISVAPHGILTLGWSFVISSRSFYDTDTKWLVAPAMMTLPFVQDIMRWTGCHSCSPPSMRSIMKTGCNIGLIPGGFQEATMFKRGKHRLFLKQKKGFIKYALQYGYSIMPVYAFGEELTFWTVDLLPKSWALWLNKFHIPTCIFVGKYLFMPDNDMDFNVVVGKVIELPKLDSPSSEDIDKYHALFLKGYQDLFNKYKGKYARDGEAAVLEIL